MTNNIIILESRCLDNSPNNSHYEYDVSIFNNLVLTTVTNSESVVNQWILQTISINSHVVGLDTESPPFNPLYYDYPNPVAILQLSVGNRCLIFQLLHKSGIPESLTNFLLQGNHVFVGVGVVDHATKLSNDHHISLPVGKTVDLATLARTKLPLMTMMGVNMRSPGLEFLSREVIGWDIKKPRHVTSSYWDSRTLSFEQIQYACVDAFVSCVIGSIWKAWEPQSS